LREKNGTLKIRHTCSLSKAVPALINGMDRTNQLYSPTNTADKHASEIEREKERKRNNKQRTNVKQNGTRFS